MFVFGRRPFLNQRMVDKLSDILGDIGIVFFGSVVIPIVLDKPNVGVLVLGLTGAAITWTFAVLIRMRGE